MANPTINNGNQVCAAYDSEGAQIFDPRPEVKKVVDVTCLSMSACPVALVANGTVATNGTITLGTALPIIYTGGIWIRLPAGAVVGGAAGLYWAVFSSTTVGVVYNLFRDPATEFTPFIPALTLAPVTGSNAAYTQASSVDITLVNVTVPADSLGKHGKVVVAPYFSFTPSVNGKILVAKWGATIFGAASVASSHNGLITEWHMRNRGATNINMRQPNNPTVFTSSASHAPTNLAIDTSVIGAVSIVANSSIATESVVLEGYTVEVYKL